MTTFELRHHNREKFPTKQDIINGLANEYVKQQLGSLTVTPFMLQPGTPLPPPQPIFRRFEK